MVLVSLSPWLADHEPFKIFTADQLGKLLSAYAVLDKLSPAWVKCIAKLVSCPNPLGAYRSTLIAMINTRSKLPYNAEVINLKSLIQEKLWFGIKTT